MIVDAAMNDLMRPALYDAWHSIDAMRPSGKRRASNVVGPVCETGDTFAMARQMDNVGAATSSSSGRPVRRRGHVEHVQCR